MTKRTDLVTTETPVVPATAEDHARAAVADVPALASTDERTRPVGITSADEAAALADLTRYEVEVVRPNGAHTVFRVDALDEAHARDHADAVGTMVAITRWK